MVYWGHCDGDGDGMSALVAHWYVPHLHVLCMVSVACLQIAPHFNSGALCLPAPLIWIRLWSPGNHLQMGATPGMSELASHIPSPFQVEKVRFHKASGMFITIHCLQG